MNFNEPSAELDLAVAKAAGIEACITGGLDRSTGRTYPHRCDRQEEDSSGHVAWRIWYPSRDMNDAIEAAKKVCQPREGHGRGFRMEIEWDVINYEAPPGADIEAVSVELICVKTEITWAEAMAPTLPLAICATLIKTER